jgi:protoheme IX farnesyltransferase
LILTILHNVKIKFLDFLTLCKPKVVLVMLATSWVGMFFAKPQDFSWATIFFATVGIAFTGSAAAVINHLVDRKIDAMMLRTQSRPLATGRISPLTAAIFACILAITGLSLLLFLVNPLSAILTLLTLGGYEILYTLFLKRATPQNIVIGGIAGAMPPLLGWVSVSNHIHPHALLLVLIIFAWTPPHFWSLAIYRQADYLNANIPMLPVTHGIPYTKFSILLYTLILVITSLLPFVVGMNGWLYLCSASMLGLIFLFQALRLYLSDHQKIAVHTFSFSIVYLLLLFAALLLDKLLFI